MFNALLFCFRDSSDSLVFQVAFPGTRGVTYDDVGNMVPDIYAATNVCEPIYKDGKLSDIKHSGSAELRARCDWTEVSQETPARGSFVFLGGWKFNREKAKAAANPQVSLPAVDAANAVTQAPAAPTAPKVDEKSSKASK